MVERTIDNRLINGFFLLAEEKDVISDLNFSLIARKAKIDLSNMKKQFSTLPQLYEFIHQKVDEQFHEKIIACFKDYDQSSTALFAANILPLIEENRNQLKHLFNLKFDPFYPHFLEKQYFNTVKSYLVKSGHTSNFPENHLSRYITGQVVLLISIWMTEDQPLPLLEFQEYFIQALNSATGHLFDAKV